jgi:hypothetical protein
VLKRNGYGFFIIGLSSGNPAFMGLSVLGNLTKQLKSHLERTLPFGQQRQ